MQAALVLISTALSSLPASRPDDSGPGPAKEKGKTANVAWVGALRKVMREGDLKGYADLSKWEKDRHFYAVGPLEGLRGEVTILGGKAYLARVSNGQAVVESKFKARACFLVYARVAKWREVPLPDGLKGDDLESWIKKEAKKAGLNVARPFPFLLRGTLAKGKVHIVNKTDDRPHRHEDHDKVKTYFTLSQRKVEVIGFYSEQHSGVFTCNSDTHMHLVTEDRKLSGHVDELQPGKGMRLGLPDVGGR